MSKDVNKDFFEQESNLKSHDANNNNRHNHNNNNNNNDGVRIQFSDKSKPLFFSEHASREVKSNISKILIG
jgi:hypothetical protein